MTRKEAIKRLKEARFSIQPYQYINEVLDMAIKALEQEPFINKPCISKGVCHEDKNKVLDKISAEIEREEDWLKIAGYNTYNVYIAFNSIKRVLKESRDKE